MKFSCVNTAFISLHNQGFLSLSPCANVSETLLTEYVEIYSRLCAKLPIAPPRSDDPCNHCSALSASGHHCPKQHDSQSRWQLSQLASLQALNNLVRTLVFTLLGLHVSTFEAGMSIAAVFLPNRVIATSHVSRWDCIHGALPQMSYTFMAWCIGTRELWCLCMSLPP